MTSPRSATAALLLLIALLVVVPLMPIALFPTAKHIAFLALALIAAAPVLIAAARGVAMPALGTPTDVALLVFAFTLLPSIALAANPAMARYGAGLLLAHGLAYVVAIKALRTPRDVTHVFVAVLATAVVIAALGLLRYREFLADDATESARSQYLSTALFPHSYLAAQYLVMVLAGGVVLLFDRALGAARRSALALALLPVAGFLLVIGSRGAYLAVTVALAGSLALRARALPREQARRFVGRVALGLGAVFVLAVLAGTLGLFGAALEFARARVALLFDPELAAFNFGRLALWRDTLVMFASDVLFGVGVGNFDTVIPSFHVSPLPKPHAHNQFLHILAEAGLVGLVAFLFVVRHAARAISRAMARLSADPERAGLLAAGTAGLIAALVYFLFETPLVWPTAGSLVFVLLAAVTRAGCGDREAIAPRGALAGATAVVVLALLFIVPTWTRYTRSAALTGGHLVRLAEAQAALAAGDPAQARALSDEAVDQIRAAGEVFPWRGDIAGMEGALLYQLGRYEEALAAYERADDLQPGTYRYLNPIGKLEMKLGRYDDAAHHLRDAGWSHQSEGARETYASLARALAKAGRHEEASMIYSDLLDYHYEAIQPSILIDFASSLIELERSLDVARRMLEEYERLSDQPRTGQISGLLEEIEKIVLRDAAHGEDVPTLRELYY